MIIVNKVCDMNGREGSENYVDKKNKERLSLDPWSSLKCLAKHLYKISLS